MLKDRTLNEKIKADDLHCGASAVGPEGAMMVRNEGCRYVALGMIDPDTEEHVLATDPEEPVDSEFEQFGPGVMMGGGELVFYCLRYRVLLAADEFADGAGKKAKRCERCLRDEVES